MAASINSRARAKLRRHAKQDPEFAKQLPPEVFLVTPPTKGLNAYLKEYKKNAADGAMNRRLRAHDIAVRMAEAPVTDEAQQYMADADPARYFKRKLVADGVMH